MTKKIAIAYTFLFLFAFTFALSFTLALAEPPEPRDPCCTVYCYGHPDRVSYYGWMDIHEPELGCQVPYNPAYEECYQMVFQCPPE